MSGLKDFASPMGIGTRLFNCLRKPFLGVSCPQVCDLQPQMGIPGAFWFECRRDHFSDKGEAFFETIS